MGRRLFLPPANPFKVLEDMEFGIGKLHDQWKEEDLDLDLDYLDVVAMSEDSDLPVKNRGRHSDTLDSRMYLPYFEGKCKRGYYYNSKIGMCVKR
jgi:hypothetical protein